MQNSELDPYLERLENAFRTSMPKLQSILGERIKSGLTGPQFFILRLLYQKGALTVSELANMLYVKPSAITSMIDRLLKQEWVLRQRDEEDRRLVFIRITELGRDIYEKAEHNRKEILKYYIGYMTEAELEMLVSMHEKFATIVAEVKCPALPED